MKQILNKISEVILFAILLLLPFSHKEISIRWLIIFIPLIVSFTYLYLSKKDYFNIHNFEIIYAILLIIIFAFTEKVNFIRQFNIPLEISKQIPFSTILLTIGILLFLLKVSIDKKLEMTEHSFARYFLFACFFLSFLMIMFYPFLFYNYQMKLELDIQFLNKILKYLTVFLLTTNYMSYQKKLNRINFGIIMSLSITVILRITIS